MRLNNLELIKSGLKEPDASYRSTPFWGWNDCLETGELKNQIREMKRQKMGGFFIHSREGLETPYLSEEWMNHVKDCVKTAKEEDLELWIYDEDKWPSGCAGGQVSAVNPEKYTAKALTLEVVPAKEGEYEHDENVLYIAEQDGEQLIFRQEISGKSEWYNNMAPTDNLNSEAVKVFCDMTHERYKTVCGEEFGKTVKGFFTDEPNFCDFFSKFTNGRSWLPWGENFLEEFEQRRGYSIQKHLPALFYDHDGCGKIRHDYWWTLTELFSKNYMKQLYDWCNENHLYMTGHVLYENDMGYGVRVSGGAMPHYRYMHAPGIDILGEQTREYLTVKQCTSVANQYGRSMVLSETYGCTGWQFTFEGQKWLGDWQFVQGVTRRCQHLSLYSITGCRKRDYPPVFNYQSTCWEDNYRLEDYFARLALCTTSGKVVRDVLVIHPLTTMWMNSKGTPDEDLNNVEMNMGWLDEHLFGLNREGEKYNRLAEGLLGTHYDFDFGDELIIREEGRIEDEKFQIKEAGYSLIIVPRVQTLLSTTVDKLEEFLRVGGKVIWIGEQIRFVDGSPSDYAKKLDKYLSFYKVSNEEELYPMMDLILKHELSIQGANYKEDTSILSMLRKLEDGYILFAVNIDRNNTHDVKIKLKTSGIVSSYDLIKGEEREICSDQSMDSISFVDEFAPAESHIYFIREIKKVQRQKIELPYLHPHRADQVWCSLPPSAKIKLNMDNALVLDTCRYRVEENPWSEILPVWEAQKEIRAKLGYQQVYYNGAPQRYTWIHKEPKVKNKRFNVEFTFNLAEEIVGEVYFAIEKPQNWYIECNQQPCLPTKEWFVDRAILKYRIPKLEKGKNKITISGIYHQETELEDAYIVGNFGVNTNREIVKAVKKLHFGDWCMQGLFHYPGNVQYCFDLPNTRPVGKRIGLKIGAYKGTLLKVYVNKAETGICMGRINTCMDITNYLKEDDNTIVIEVVGSLRNLLGPLHQTYTGCSRISWEDFRTTGGCYSNEYVLEQYGLMEQITLVELETKR